MNRTKMIYFLSAMVLIIGCYALNLSYSLFVQTEEKEVVNSTVPSLAYNIENNVYTIPANSGQLIKLKVINSGSSDIKYGISVDDTKGAYIQLVEKEGNDIVGTLETSTVEGENPSEEVLVYVTNPTDSEITDLTFDITAKYLTLNIDETFKDNSNIDCINTVKPLSNAILANAKSGEEGRSIYTEPEDLPTTPAAAPSGATEKILSYTDDDYTATTGNPSYYFRGNVSDNYVNFANMCWRIVRIEGDGSVKLILEDSTKECSSNIQNSTIGCGTYGFAQIESNSGALVTIKSYLNPNDTHYGEMSTAFYDFQSTSLNNYTDKLKGGNWCMGDKAYTQSGTQTQYTYTELTDITSWYKSASIFYYDSYVRLYGDNEKGYQPTLKCNGTVLNEFSDGTPMYVSSLNADEFIYAGGYISWTNPNASVSNIYLINNYYKQNYISYWTLSPSYYNYREDKAYVINYQGKIFDANVSDISNCSYRFRPMISLVKDSLTTTGDGTITAPYVIG